jgi:hypothetical protein
LLKQLQRDDEIGFEQKQAGVDPTEDARPEIPKVKMSRADSSVIQLIEHLKDATPK